MKTDLNKLPDKYLITGTMGSIEDDFLQKVRRSLARNIKLIQLRVKNVSAESYADIASKVADICQTYGCRLILNCPFTDIPNISFEGIHLTSKRLMSCEAIPSRLRERFWLTASCHNLDELRKAELLALDFAILTPIQPTNSHPCAPHLGWNQAKWLRKQTKIPLYAAGGMFISDIAYAKKEGFQGIAAISSLWD